MQIKLFKINLIKSNPTIWGGLLFILLLIAFLIWLIISLSATRQTAKVLINSTDKQDITALDSDNEEIKSLLRDKCWIKTQLDLSKEDSMSLGINLKDSIVQLQLKGLPLLQSKIDFIRPEGFLSEIDPAFYSNLFGRPIILIDGKSNFIKRPIRKMKVVSGSDAQPLSNEIVKTKRFYWEFVTDNNIRVVINGSKISNDSLGIIQPSIFTDMLKFTFKRKSVDIENQNFHPTLFLWMNDKDAKAIYRALPVRIKIALRS